MKLNIKGAVENLETYVFIIENHGITKYNRCQYCARL